MERGVFWYCGSGFNESDENSFFFLVACLLRWGPWEKFLLNSDTHRNWIMLDSSCTLFLLGSCEGLWILVSFALRVEPIWTHHEPTWSGGDRHENSRSKNKDNLFINKNSKLKYQHTRTHKPIPDSNSHTVCGWQNVPLNHVVFCLPFIVTPPWYSNTAQTQTTHTFHCPHKLPSYQNANNSWIQICQHSHLIGNQSSTELKGYE